MTTQIILYGLLALSLSLALATDHSPLQDFCVADPYSQGMNKMVINHLDKLFVTNDAATIVNELEVQHPAAKILVLAGKAQQEEIGDGANLTISFAGELLQNAEELIRMGLHPSEIISGYTKAINKTVEIIEQLVEKGSESMDVRNKDQVIRQMKAAVASKQFGQEDILCSLVADVIISIISCRLLFVIDRAVLVNGLACKDPKLAGANDFFFPGLHLAGNTSNAVGSVVTPVTVSQMPGLNTLGITMIRIDYAPWGINPPHTHPRASEILTVLEGSLEVGFVTSNPENRHITKVLQKGDVFVFPIGLVHYQRNAGSTNAVAIAALSSQNPGVIIVGNAVFGTVPDIAGDILAKAFQVDKTVITYLQSKF